MDTIEESNENAKSKNRFVRFVENNEITALKDRFKIAKENQLQLEKERIAKLKSEHSLNEDVEIKNIFFNAKANQLKLEKERIAKLKSSYDTSNMILNTNLQKVERPQFETDNVDTIKKYLLSKNCRNNLQDREKARNNSVRFSYRIVYNKDGTDHDEEVFITENNLLYEKFKTRQEQLNSRDPYMSFRIIYNNADGTIMEDEVEEEEEVVVKENSLYKRCNGSDRRVSATSEELSPSNLYKLVYNNGEFLDDGFFIDSNDLFLNKNHNNYSFDEPVDNTTSSEANESEIFATSEDDKNALIKNLWKVIDLKNVEINNLQNDLALEKHRNQAKTGNNQENKNVVKDLNNNHNNNNVSNNNKKDEHSNEKLLLLLENKKLKMQIQQQLDLLADFEYKIDDLKTELYAKDLQLLQANKKNGD
jgi:hypothetical protein